MGLILRIPSFINESCQTASPNGREEIFRVRINTSVNEEWAVRTVRLFQQSYKLMASPTVRHGPHELGYDIEFVRRDHLLDHYAS